MWEHDPITLRRAQDFYAVYCASSDGKNYQGLPCPAWADLTPAVRGHWYTVALRASQGGESLVIQPDGEVTMPEPSAAVLGHLPDPDHALQVWQRYSKAP